MNAGDTLYIPLPGTSLDSHRWVIISDPAVHPEQVVIVNMTSWRADKDQACVLDPADFPVYITHRTCINYFDAKTPSLTDLQRLQSTCSNFTVGAAVSPALLQKIRDAIPDSRMKMGVVDILVTQGVIDEP